MKSRVNLLSLAVATTVVLLVAGAGLVVLGIFNEYLGWNIFSPPVKKVLWGIFFSSVALGAFGAAISIVLALEEVVRALRRMVPGASPAAPGIPVPSDPRPPETRPPRRLYLAWMAALLAAAAAAVGGVDLVNRHVERQRTVVFKRMVREQMSRVGPLLARELESVSPCKTCLRPEVAGLLASLESQPCCESVSLVIADPTDAAALWRYGDRWPSSTEGFLERYFIADDVARAIKLALAGDTAWVDQMNAGPAFNWIEVLRDPAGRPRAALRILGNPREDYREEPSRVPPARAR